MRESFANLARTPWLFPALTFEKNGVTQGTSVAYRTVIHLRPLGTLLQDGSIPDDGLPADDAVASWVASLGNQQTGAEALRIDRSAVEAQSGPSGCGNASGISGSMHMSRGGSTIVTKDA